MPHPFPHHKDEARTWAQDLLRRSDWVILDTETTGLDSRAVAIQIGVVEPDGTPLINTLVRPEGRIPPEATAIHGITDSMVQKAPTFPEIYQGLLQALKGKVVVCYNADYDSRILQQTACQHNLRVVPLTWQCAMQKYSQFCGLWSDRHGNYTWQKLPPSRWFPQLQHQAIGDCYATLELLHAMAGHPVSFCARCGLKQIAGHSFCSNCGSEVQSSRR